MLPLLKVVVSALFLSLCLVSQLTDGGRQIGSPLVHLLVSLATGAFMVLCGTLGALMERKSYGSALKDPDVNCLAGVAGQLLGFFGAWMVMLVLLLPGL